MRQIVVDLPRGPVRCAGAHSCAEAPVPGKPSNPPVLSPPTSVTLHYSTPDGDFDVTVDPRTVGAVVWDPQAASAMANVRTQPGQAPPGVVAQPTSASNTLSTASTAGKVPPSCYWVAGQLICC